MKKIVALLSFLLASYPAQAAQPVNIYSADGHPIGATLSGGVYGLNISGSISATNPAVGATGSAVPADASYTAVKDGSGNLVGLLSGQQTMANSLACVLPSDQSSIPVTGTFWQATQPVSAAALPLPTGAATSALQTSTITALGSPFQAGGSIGNTSFGISGTLPAFTATPTFNLGTLNGAATAALQTTGNTALTTINTTLGSPFQAGASIGNTSFGISGTLPAFTATPTVNLGTIGGASTAAKQPALGTAGTASADVITIQGIASMTALKVDGSAVTQPVSIATAPALVASSAIIGKVGIDQTTPGTTNGVQVNAALPVGANVIGKVSIDQTTPGTTNLVSLGSSTVQIKAPLNSTGSGSASAATVSTVITLSAPSNAVGAFLMNIDTSTANIRWAVNRTATATLGQQLQPGRDVWIPTTTNISLVAESGTQTYDVQWISQ